MLNTSKSSKSLLAKLLASENITIEHRKVPTAYFDTKNRVMVLPIWKNMSEWLNDLLLGHEVGHALFTPAEGWHTAVTGNVSKGFKTYLNVVEDVRIEKQIQRKFPGLKTSFIKGYSELMHNDFFGVNSGELDVNTLPLIDRINLHYKVGAYLNVQFSSDEQEYLNRLDSLDTWEDVYNIAKELFENGKQELRDKLEDEFYDEEDIDEDGNDYDYDDADEDEEDTEYGEGKRSGSRAGTSDDFDDLDPESITDRNFRKREKDFLSDETKPYYYVNMPTPKLENIVVPYKNIIKYYNDFKYPNEEIVGVAGFSYTTEQANELIETSKTKLLKRFYDTNKKYVSYLIKEFELKRNARQFARASVSKTGELDMKKVFGYKFNDDLFRRMTVVPKGKSHGLIMFIDYSGSMTDNIKSTIEQTLVLATFCRKVNIPFRVYAFTDLVSNNLVEEMNYPNTEEYKEYLATSKYINNPKLASKYAKFSENDKELCLNSNGFRLREYISSEMSGTEFKEAVKYWLLVGELHSNRSWNYKQSDVSLPREFKLGEFEVLNGTPLNEAIVSSVAIVKQFKASYKLDVVNTVFLTDGESNDTNTIIDKQRAIGQTHIGTTHSVLSSNVIIRDVSTMSEGKKPPGADLTVGLLNLLKNITGVNVIGFFITPQAKHAKRYILGRIERSGTHITDFDEKFRSFRKTKFFMLNNVGYDDYYIIPGGDDLEIKEDEMDVNSNSSKNELKTAFMKMQKSKSVNRVLLSRFIDKIA
jgi:hypothetical protein